MTDGVMAREFYLFITNDGQLYRQQTQPIIKNLAIKKVKGVYDRELALKLWGYLVESGIKKYKKEFPGYYRVDAGTKRACAKMIASEYVEEIQAMVTKMKSLKKAGKPWQMRV
ncbi:MAG: hypothetical protein PHG61_03615 [Candidatus Marinimicrobia bacterium]|nr:hypothetical protein [Candidatus Neomarinimicrobiota bacterium]